jgi:ABC-type Na+ efflux pump permease subunit
VFAFAVMTKDLRRRLRDPLSFLLWLGIPIAIAGMIKLAFGGGGDGKGPQAHVLIVDEDGSFLSELLVGALATKRGPELPLAGEKVTEAEGRARIDAGDASALLVIPAGFADSLLLEEPCTLELVTNPAQTILPGIVEEALSMLVDATFYLHRVFGEPLRAMAVDPPVGRDTLDSAEVARISVQINDLVERVLALLTPPVMKVVVATTPDDEPNGMGFAQLFFPSMLFMTLFFLAQGMSEDLWVEKSAGTLRRALVTPNRAAGLVLGKLLAALTFAALVTLIGMLLARAVFGISLANLPLAVAWATASAAMLTLFLYLLQVHASSQRAGNLLTNLVTMPLLMLGGSFFPFEAMPAGMAALGRKTPNGWALVQLKSILADALDPARLGIAFGGLALVCAVLFLLTARRLAGAFARS